ncbi:hypothetical protein EQW78_01000 [Oerskovia turbata]|uniref:DUF1129 family protein n=1 Tax=Oerskovia turbata TaxID=1713 RepID=A0A4Q1L1U0_9CELL|nr:hypothetical protein [Oerskovia turbata]RXR26258.1 hypothetical protein EQW73_07945 [Oerskovia turbata]RXR36760.1 hypothetical protein EQW78_01000 [Oerskovia turbata]TGJ97448.1 hypothetical protein DLJ96_05655 [Actinotalea fermentans ATCC 43279 = JCM 9966 = DSM 3133]
MSRTSEKRTATRYEIERRLAPHVEEEWAEAFVIELRLLDVPGTALGAALAEVESHCTDSGEPAAEAFGDPVAYARSLDLPVEPDGRWEVVTVLGPSCAQFLGLLLLGWGGSAVLLAGRAGEVAPSVDVTAGMLAMILAFGAGILLFYRHSAAMLRLIMERPVVSFFALAGCMAVLVAVPVLLDGVLVALPAWPVAVGGGLALAAGTVWSAVQARRGTLDDPIVSPLPGEPQGAPDRRTRLLSATVTWIVPVFALASLGVTWLLLGR